MISHRSSRARSFTVILCLTAVVVPVLARGQVTPRVSRAQGQVTRSLTGMNVVLKPGVALRVGGRLVETGQGPRVYVAGRAKGDWLWLTSGAIGGWVRVADVVPLDRAVDETVAALINRGNAAAAQGDQDRALADYDEAMRLDPGDALAQMNRGLVRQSRGDLDGAIADYTGAIAWGLSTAQVYNNRGQAWERKKEYVKAILDYDRAIELAPKYVLAWLNRGRTRQAAGDLENALADYEAAIRLDPNSPWGYALLASLYSKSARPELRDGPRALELARTACELGGAHSAYLCDVRADAHEAVGEGDAAAEWRAKARAAASKTSAPESFAKRARPKLDRPQSPLAPPGTDTAGAPPRGGEANVGYLSSIPKDYRGVARNPPGRGIAPRWVDSGQQGSPTWLQQAMERNQAELRALERNKLELDEVLLRMQRGQEERLRLQQERQNRP